MFKNNKREYQINELIYGQVRGYPWWPGYISSKESNGDYKVVFFKDFSYSRLNVKKIKPFLGKIKFSDSKCEFLKEAIASAMRVYKGESTVMNEYNQVIQLTKKEKSVQSKKQNKLSSLPKKKLKNSSFIKKTISKKNKKQNQLNKKKTITKLKIINSKKELKMSHQENNDNDLCPKIPFKNTSNKKNCSKKQSNSIMNTLSEKNIELSNKEINDCHMNPSRSVTLNLSLVNQNNYNKDNFQNIIFSSKQIKSENHFGYNYFENKESELNILEEIKFDKNNKSIKIVKTVLFQIEQEMDKFVKTTISRKNILLLEEKLKEWNKTISSLPNFKLIFSTNIGNYLTTLKQLFFSKIKQTKKYELIIQSINKCKQLILSKIYNSFFGEKSNEVSLEIINNSINQNYLSLQANISPASKDTFAMMQQANMLPSFNNVNSIDSFFNEKRNYQTNDKIIKKYDHFLNNQMIKHNKRLTERKFTQVFNNNKSEEYKGKLTASVENQIEKEKSILTRKTIIWDHKKKIKESTRKILKNKIGKYLYKCQKIHFVSQSQALKIGEIFENIIGNMSYSVYNYQNSIIKLISLIKKMNDTFYTKIIYKNGKQINISNLKTILQEYLQT